MSEVAGVTLRVTAEDGVSEELRAAMRRVRRPAQMYEEIGASLHTSTQHRFEEKVGPDGERWARHSEATLAMYAREGRKPNMLQRSRRLYGSLNYQVFGGGLGVLVGVASEYGRIHQLGGMAGRNRQVRIPARPYLGLSAEDLSEIEAIVTEHLEGGR